jgi:hypothetical protein
MVRQEDRKFQTSLGYIKKGEVDSEKLEHLLIVGGNVNDTAPREDSMVVSQKN